MYLEPEGLDVDEIYVNGFSDVVAARHTARNWFVPCPASGGACDAAARLCRGYDSVQPTELKATLKRIACGDCFSRADQRDFRLRQEAAGQGIVAGVNAAKAVRREPAHAGPGRGYIGILVDDLVTRGCLWSRIECSRRGRNIACFCVDNA